MIIFLPSCKNRPSLNTTNFKAIYPDTSSKWVGEATKEDMKYARALESKFNLSTLTAGAPNTEIRIWQFKSAFDPQTLHILMKLKSDSCEFRTIKYGSAGNNRLLSDHTILVNGAVFDRINLESYWLMPSQSDMPDGDRYGCMDGSSVLLELADIKTYAIKWYRCPAMHKSADNAFEMVSDMMANFHTLETRQ